MSRSEPTCSTPNEITLFQLFHRCNMVKLSKTRFWDVFSTVAYFLAFLLTMVLVVGLALFVMMQPQLLGIA